MNIRFIETFVWLHRLRSFRATGKKLNATQAAISSRIIALEDIFGTRLFDRSSREITLTPSGLRMLPYAERILKLYMEMRTEVAEIDKKARVIRIGVIEIIAHSWFPDFVARVRAEYPDCEFEINCETPQELIARFHEGSFDLILQTDALFDAGVENLPLCEYVMRWVASPRLGLSGQHLNLSDLANRPLIAFSRDSGPHRAMEQMFSEGCEADPRINCMTTLGAIVRLTCDGLGVSAVPPAVIQRELQASSLDVLSVVPEFPRLASVASFRSSNLGKITGHVARLAQATALSFTRTAGPGIAIARSDPTGIPVREHRPM